MLSLGPIPAPRRAALAALVLAALALAAGLIWSLARDYYVEDARSTAQQRGAFYRSTIVAALEQFDHLPAVLSEDPLLANALALQAVRPSANARLDRFARAAGLDAIYLMDPTGLTVAASNAGTPNSFVGQSYAFRPYFTDAMQGASGAFFAIGATTRQPGYFLSAPIPGADGAPVGVVALKRDLTQLARDWAASGEQVFVSNGAGVVVLSGTEALTYRAVAPLDAAARDALAASRQFGNQPLLPLAGFDADAAVTVLEGTPMVHAALPVGRMGWTLHYVTPLAGPLAQARLVLGVAAFAILALLAVLLVTRQRRIRRALGLSQEARRSLARANAALAAEIAERREAQASLAAAQADLERSSRMAALGQLSASVTHELGQPIAAMQTWLGASALPGGSTDPETTALLARLGGIVGRMQGIVRQLRFFAHPQPPETRPADLREVVIAAIDLMDARAAPRIVADLPPDPVIAPVDAPRLEQVLVNLLRNARDASEPSDPPIRVSLRPAGTTVRIAVRDYGHGLSAPEAVFEPFYTTKASGEGMGLGLAISAAIVREHHGTLSSMQVEGRGAKFVVTLPCEVPAAAGMVPA